MEIPINFSPTPISRRLGPGEPMYIIAEIGTAHNGDRSKARELIQAVKESGADCAKFQVVIAREILHPLTGQVPLPGGNIPLFKRFEQLQQPREFYEYIYEQTLQAGLDFLASPFGSESAQMLQDIGVPWFKVASPELNHTPLLDQLASYGKPMILSSGVSLLKDIERALEITSGVPVALLHCITAYPAPPEEYNLRVLPALSRIFGIPVGVSDHSMDPGLVPLTSLLEGSALLEKHICLDRKTDGLDDPIAQEPQSFKEMVDSIRHWESQSQEDLKDYLDAHYGADTIEAVRGTGRKTLAPAEAANYQRTNRSIHVLGPLKKDHTLRSVDLEVLRTEKILRPGLHPDFLSLVIGKKLARDVEEGQGLVWEDILNPAGTQ